jgi:uncharacterized membrane protein YeaQ/YmgE (transglycosylase-associated protein family)
VFGLPPHINPVRQVGRSQLLKIILLKRKVSVQRAGIELAMSILWTIIIGFVAGLIAKFLLPGNKNEPSGFILTTLLGIAGAFVATYLGQALGWYKAGEGAGIIGAIVGAIIVLVVWGIFANRRGQGV